MNQAAYTLLRIKELRKQLPLFLLDQFATEELALEHDKQEDPIRFLAEKTGFRIDRTAEYGMLTKLDELLCAMVIRVEERTKNAKNAYFGLQLLLGEIGDLCDECVDAENCAAYEMGTEAYWKAMIGSAIDAANHRAIELGIELPSFLQD